ncbi:hypothetical protein FQA39_LY15413 [Lamprigera yunnana]|nr:hypothetical protein FQA39_LY15413 [Lamprigera yunnana]
MEKFQNAHYFSLSSQGNIYTLTTLPLVNNSNKLLVASLRSEVICFEYTENSSDVLIPCTKEVSFTYLPNGAEIISLDAFNKSEDTNDFVIGITIIKNSTDLHTLETFLNIYSGWEESNEFNIDSISQNCLNNIELRYIPYHLTHTYLVTWDDNVITNKELVFLLSGSNNKVHIYQENKINHTYKEIDIAEYFPEFVKPPSVVVWMDVYYYSNCSERLTAFGCECGYIRLCRFDVKAGAIMFNFSTNFNNIISNVRIYPEARSYKQPECMKNKYVEAVKENSTPILNLIVTNTLLPPVHFRDVLQFGLGKYDCFPRLNMTSVFTSTEIADINFDGTDEILIGTSTHEIIAYEYNETQGWHVLDIRHFATPILGLKYVDITGDGIKEITVLTMKGVVILQHDHDFLNEILIDKLKILTIPDINSLSIEN